MEHLDTNLNICTNSVQSDGERDLVFHSEFHV